VRRAGYEFLISPQARDLLQDEGIVVIGYKTIQQAWSRSQPLRAVVPVKCGEWTDRPG
jgi:hypothetical protein